MFVTTLSAGARIAFMEQLGEKVSPQFRTAVILAYPDAVALRDLLTRQLAAFESAKAIEIEIGPGGKPIIKDGK